VKLDTAPRLTDPDALFALLVEAHQGLDAEASRRLDARLVLLLANHVGDMAILREAIAEARRCDSRPPAPPSLPADGAT
jgi:hypothetical protein